MCNCVNCCIIIQAKYSFFFFLYFTDPENQDETCSVKWCRKVKTIKKETREDFGFRVQDCKADWFLHTSSTTWYTNSVSKIISEVDTDMVNYIVNTSLITSESKYDDSRISEVSQAGSSSTSHWSHFVCKFSWYLYWKCWFKLLYNTCWGWNNCWKWKYAMVMTLKLFCLQKMN